MNKTKQKARHYLIAVFGTNGIMATNPVNHRDEKRSSVTRESKTETDGFTPPTETTIA